MPTQYAWEARQHSDFTLMLSQTGEELKLHKTILAQKSDFFDVGFGSGVGKFPVCRGRTIQIDTQTTDLLRRKKTHTIEGNADAIKDMIQFIYTGQYTPKKLVSGSSIPEWCKQFLKVAAMAAKFEVKELPVLALSWLSKDETTVFLTVDIRVMLAIWAHRKFKSNIVVEDVIRKLCDNDFVECFSYSAAFRGMLVNRNTIRDELCTKHVLQLGEDPNFIGMLEVNPRLSAQLVRMMEKHHTGKHGHYCKDRLEVESGNATADQAAIAMMAQHADDVTMAHQDGDAETAKLLEEHDETQAAQPDEIVKREDDEPAANLHDDRVATMEPNTYTDPESEESKVDVDQAHPNQVKSISQQADYDPMAEAYGERAPPGFADAFALQTDGESTALADTMQAQPGQPHTAIPQANAEWMEMTDASQAQPGQTRGVKRKRRNGRTAATGVLQDQPQQANATTYQANAAPIGTVNIAQAQPGQARWFIDLTGDDE